MNKQDVTLISDALAWERKKLETEYWKAHKVLGQHPFSSRSAQMEVMHYQAKLTLAIEAMREANNAVQEVKHCLAVMPDIDDDQEATA